MDTTQINTEQCRTLVNRIRGQTIDVPDILSIIYNNPTIGLNDTDYLKPHYEKWLAAYVSTESQRIKQRKVNTPLMTSYFYSTAPKESLPVLFSTVAWAFLWDDQVDSGSLTLGQVATYCDDSIAYIRSCLQPERNIRPPPPGRLHNCECFADIGRAMQHGKAKADRDRYADALADYINGVREASASWQEGVSSIEDFVERRIRTIDVVPTLYPNAWGCGLKLPEAIWNGEPLNRMIREVSIGVAMWNDVYSLKKELAQMEMDNIVPLLVYHHDVSAQEAVDMVIELLRKSYDDFCAAAERLEADVQRADAAVKKNVRVWKEACLDVLLGHVAWSMQVPRYMLGAGLKGGAAFKVVLLYS
jgi:hypothetical protein